MADFGLSSRDDFQKMVDAQNEETLTLEYKASPALTRDSKNVHELCKDASAMANSAGGQIIYGIQEDKKTHKPSRVDDGVTDEKITREWIHQTLSSNVHPRMDGITVQRIPLSANGYGFVITIPPTQTGPHQAPDKKYYKRFELQSVPMEDYEVRDVMRRSTTPSPFIKWAFLRDGERTEMKFLPREEISQPVFLAGMIGNRSIAPAYHAVIHVGLNPSILSESQGDPWRFTRHDEMNEYGKLAWLIQVLASPPSLPIFKEVELPLDKGLRLNFNSRTLGDAHRWPIVTDIRAPGFSATEAWYIHQEGTSLRLLPPGHPLLR